MHVPPHPRALSLAMLLIGFAGIGFVSYRRKAGEIFVGSTMFFDASFRFSWLDRMGRFRHGTSPWLKNV